MPVIIECYETSDGEAHVGSSDRLLGSCQTTLGALIDPDGPEKSESGLFFTFALSHTLFPIILKTKQDAAFSMGKATWLHARSTMQCNDWVQKIQEEVQRNRYQERYTEGLPTWKKILYSVQDQASVIHSSSLVTFIVYTTILVALMSTVIQHEIAVEDEAENIFDVLENVYCGIFSIELALNLVSNFR
jgi:hypothetical protein